MLVGFVALLKRIGNWIRRLFGGGNVETIPEPGTTQTSVEPAPSREDPGPGPLN